MTSRTQSQSHPWCLLCDAGHEPCEDYEFDVGCDTCGRRLNAAELDDNSDDPAFPICRPCRGDAIRVA